MYLQKGQKVDYLASANGALIKGSGFARIWSCGYHY